MNNEHLIRLLVENILHHPHDFDWSIQGLGMMRVYLAPMVRLHIWDRSLWVAGVSPVHTHPWDFDSLIVAGRMHNRRYQSDEYDGQEWNRVKIKCGEDACTVEEPTKVILCEQPLESYGVNQRYTQSADEIHWSLPEDGTVTICTRIPKADRDHAFVYWRGKGPWVDAKPRPATPEEVHEIVNRSLAAWF